MCKSDIFKFVYQYHYYVVFQICVVQLFTTISEIRSVSNFFKTFLKARGMQMFTVQGQVVLVSQIVPSIFIDLKKDLPKYLHTFV